jgi:hypothetical protein
MPRPTLYIALPFPTIKIPNRNLQTVHLFSRTTEHFLQSLGTSVSEGSVLCHLPSLANLPNDLDDI